MISRRASRYGKHVRGFTVIELLIAMVITLLIAGALAQSVPPARAAFDRVPAELDLQQRGRTAINLLAQTLRSAIAIDADSSSGTVATLTVIAPTVAGAQGVLDVDQPGGGGAITLATSPCPNVKDVCGFTPGMFVAFTDATGASEVFAVASTNVGARKLVPDRMLPQAYPAGSAIAEIEQYTFSLAGQADGSFSLMRETAAGAVQPIVDSVSALSFTVSGRQIEIAVSVQAATESLRRVLAQRVFRTSIALRNVS